MMGIVAIEPDDHFYIKNYAVTIGCIFLSDRLGRDYSQVL
jgi:hypothetical protein